MDVPQSQQVSEYILKLYFKGTRIHSASTKNEADILTNEMKIVKMSAPYYIVPFTAFII